MTTIPGFLTKTYEIFNTPDYTDCCGWGNNGSTIVIKKIEQFSKSVLPKYFKHSNFQSFVRQLNMYDFRKTVQDPNHGEFQHPNFRQDRPELLPNIKRKAHHKSSESTKKSGGLHLEGSEYAGLNSSLTAASLSAAASLGNMGNNSIIFTDGSQSIAPKGLLTYDFKEDGSPADMEHLGSDVRQQGVREELEMRLQNMESESARVASENIALKQLVMDSRHKQAVMQDKMERVLKTLYNVFMGGGNSNNLSISANGADNDPSSNRASLAPQMLETLMFRIDSSQNYGLRMNSDIANAPGGVDIGSIFGEEDTVPLSTIAADMTQLVTSSRNGTKSRSATAFPYSADGSDLPLISTACVRKGQGVGTFGANNNRGFACTNMSHGNFTGQQLEAGGGLAGQPISQMQSFDTLASRVSAPNLVHLLEMSSHKLTDDAMSKQSNVAAESKTRGGSEMFGGGGLVRQKSIYPGHGNDEYSRTEADLASSANTLNGIPLDRQDSDNFSWSSLFSMNSVDGYGLINSTGERSYPPETPGVPSPSETNKIIKVETSQDEKHMKRGIAELGSLSDGANYNLVDKTGDNRENTFRRQRVSSSYPPLPLQAPLTTSAAGNNAANNDASHNSMGSIGPAGAGSMDPPSHEKAEPPDVYYQNLSRLNESNSLTRIDSLELTIASLLKSMDSFDANNNNCSGSAAN